MPFGSLAVALALKTAIFSGIAMGLWVLIAVIGALWIIFQGD
jgi:hypothetical protein